ncbi:PoNe immunity protein domain-containing protein [uncultured Pseudomonas sp.]|uniref:PoNe immunity protein domain-containing protein n=1 Tax=uncultured Pseudomonas sp. TaxID=114707 RepID=UPI0030DB2265
MIRDVMGGLVYWDEWVLYAEDRFNKVEEVRLTPAKNSDYEPQYVFQLAQKNWHQMFRRYSRGDAISELPRYFPALLDAWEEAERLGAEVWTQEQQYTRHAWVVNLDHYIICFWLVGLALALEIPDEQWNRLVALIGNEGEDVLLDRIIATRTPSRKVGTELCYRKPYARLLAAIDAPPAKQAESLKAFVTHWYKELGTGARSCRAKQTVPYSHPYWYKYGDTNFEGGAYFGRWCVEAVAAVKAFGLDDRLCLGHEHYPGDLLRPNGPSTHPVRADIVPTIETPNNSAVTEKKHWLSRLFRR